MDITKKTLRYSCPLCGDHDFNFENEPSNPGDEAVFIKTISCSICGRVVNPIELFEHDMGMTYEEFSTATIN